MNYRITRLSSACLLLLMLSAACKPAEVDESAAEEEAKAAEIPADQTMAGATKDDKFYVVATPSINPIPFQELFELEVEIYRDAQREELAEDAVLDQVRALMPAHRHGMKNEPEIEALSGGKFLVKGMRFHMQGEGEDGHWTLDYLVREGSTIDSALFDLQCCRD